MIGKQIARMTAKVPGPAPEHRVQSLAKETTPWSRIAIGLHGCAALFVTSAVLAGPLSSGASARPAAMFAAPIAKPGPRLIEVADGFKVADASGPAGAPLPLRIELPGNSAETYSFLMFRKLPPNFELSSGFGAKTYWAVSLHDAGNLRIVPPGDYAGSFELEVLLVKAIGADPERRVARVEFKPSRTAAPADTPVSDNILTAVAPNRRSAALPPTVVARADPGPDRPPRAKPMTPAQRTSMVRGDRYLNQGDIAAARLIYHSLARQNIAEAALAMARTYDPEILTALAVQGLRPDIGEAKVWYEKAKELGSEPAAQRLATLDALGY
jgi:hypothetical protein